MNYKNKAALIAALAVIAGATSANAALTFTLSSSINGTAPTSSNPWLTAVFEDVSGGVQLTLTSKLNVSSEFIDQVVFNVKDTITPSSITITEVNPDQAVDTVVSITKGAQNGQNLTGGGNPGKNFDIKIDWSQNDSQGARFNGTDVEQFKFVLTGLTENDFNEKNSGGYHIAAHVQGIPQSDGTTISGAIADTTPVPEPSTYIAAALLALPVLAQVRRMRKAA